MTFYKYTQTSKTALNANSLYVLLGSHLAMTLFCIIIIIEQSSGMHYKFTIIILFS